MPRLPLEIQLNVDRDPDRFGELAYEWLDGLSRRLCPDERSQLDGLPARVTRSAEPFGPLGASGTLFGVVSVDRRPPGQRSRGAERNCSAAGMRWLRKELAELPEDAHLWLGRLDERGHRSGWLLSLTVKHVPESPGWLRLLAHIPEDEFLDPRTGPATQQRWLSAVYPFADRLDPGFGHLSYAYEDNTALEHSLRGPRESRDHAFTVNDSRRYLRGYSWLTIVPRELADRLGGVDALRASGAFADVRPLAQGGVWLLATEDYRDFTDEALARVFRVLAPVLRPGQPIALPQMHGKPPHRLVLQNAAEVHPS